MKKIALSFAFLLTISFQTDAQWYIQYNSSESFFKEVDFVSQDTGWVAGIWIMLRTTNAGTSWDTIIQRPQSNTTIEGMSFVDNLNGWYLEMDADNNNCKIYNTINAGDSWSLQNTFPTFTLLWDLLFINSNIGFAVGYDLTHPVVWKTINGGNTWNLVVIDSLGGPMLYKLFFLDENNGWAAGEGIYRTFDGGISWNLVGLFSFGIADIQFTTPNIGWYSDALGLWKTTDGGTNWLQQSSMGDGWHTSSLYFLDSDTGYFCPFNGILKTTNGGANWGIQIQDYNLNLSDILFINPDVGWCIGYEPGKIFHTVNGGLPVELISFNATHSEAYVLLTWSTATELNNSGFEIERSIDKQNWTTLGFINGNGTTTEPQSYSYVDKEIPAGKYHYRLKQIDFDGTFEYSKTIEVEINLPAKFSLDQNYPNPFNSSSVIKYSIPKSSQVTLKIFNTLGEEIETLVNEEKPVGTYELTWNATNLPSGVYFYRLQVVDPEASSGQGFVQTRKMILLK